MRDWQRLFKHNGVPFDSLGAKKELRVLPEYLEDGEIVYAICCGTVTGGRNANSFDRGTNTWIVALTSERFLFLDAAMLSSSVDTVSIRLDKVQSVSASQGWLLGKIMIDIASGFVSIDNCQKGQVKVMAELANKLLRAASKPQAMKGRNCVEEVDIITQLERLAALQKSGALTEAEYQNAKGRLLM